MTWCRPCAVRVIASPPASDTSGTIAGAKAFADAGAPPASAFLTDLPMQSTFDRSWMLPAALAAGLLAGAFVGWLAGGHVATGAALVAVAEIVLLLTRIRHQAKLMMTTSSTSAGSITPPKTCSACAGRRIAVPILKSAWAPANWPTGSKAALANHSTTSPRPVTRIATST
jgi:hypothetical protein